MIPLSVIPLSSAWCNIILRETTSYEPGLDESLVGQLEGLSDGQRDLLGQLVADEDEAEKRKVIDHQHFEISMSSLLENTVII